jgi:hypothetical protein
MQVYVLLCEAYSDDARLLGVYSSEALARQAYDAWEDRCYFPFYRIERRDLDALASEYDPAFLVYSGGEEVE